MILCTHVQKLSSENKNFKKAWLNLEIMNKCIVSSVNSPVVIALYAYCNTITVSYLQVL